MAIIFLKDISIRLKIFIVIPVYNEHATILGVLSALQQKGYTNIILVDDGSSDGIKSTIRNFPINYLRHSCNLGQGAALQTGFEFAKKNRADAVITFDADEQHSVSDIPLLLLPLQQNKADIVFGSRFMTQPLQHLPLSKKIILRVARYINYLFSGLLLSDAHNGLRALNRNALEKIVITENRMAHASEILFETKKHNLRYTEVPVHIMYTDYSTQKGQSVWDSIKVLFDLVLYKFFK